MIIPDICQFWYNKMFATKKAKIGHSLLKSTPFEKSTLPQLVEAVTKLAMIMHL